jgi:hypothetical protein
MSTPVMAPDVRAVHKHLDGALFRAGVTSGRWRLISFGWPYVTIAVRAAPREGAPTEFVIRFELTGYPNAAPTGDIWDRTAGTLLPAVRRPKGDAIGMIFRPDGWNSGAGMYAPWDRAGLQAHPEWAQTYRRSAWHAERTLTFVLEQVSERLMADDYLGV